MISKTDLKSRWPEIKKLFRRAFNSSFHYSIASVTAEGTPHVTPIGSLILLDDLKGFYFEIFTKNLPTNLKTNQRVCVMAVDDGFWFWLRSLIAGRYSRPVGFRLYGTVGERRVATPEEIGQFHKRVRHLSFLKGYKLLWKTLHDVRDIQFDSFEEVFIGPMMKKF